MTMTRPWRRITRHLLQIFLTLGLTFTGVPHCSADPHLTTARAAGMGTRRTDARAAQPSLVAVDDPPSGQVVRREFDDDSVLGQDADVVLPHLAADVGQDLVTVGQLNPEH